MELKQRNTRRIDWLGVGVVVMSFVTVMVFAWIASGAKMPWEG